MQPHLPLHMVTYAMVQGLSVQRPFYEPENQEVGIVMMERLVLVKHKY